MQAQSGRPGPSLATLGWGDGKGTWFCFFPFSVCFGRVWTPLDPAPNVSPVPTRGWPLGPSPAATPLQGTQVRTTEGQISGRPHQQGQQARGPRGVWISGREPEFEAQLYCSVPVLDSLHLGCFICKLRANSAPATRWVLWVCDTNLGNFSLSREGGRQETHVPEQGCHRPCLHRPPQRC